jgi:transposase
MPRPHPPYPPAYRAQILELVRGGRSPESVAEEYEPSAQTIRNWLKQEELDGPRRGGGLTPTEREELTRLRRENDRLRVEREILSKAATWFAREIDESTSASSGSSKRTRGVGR